MNLLLISICDSFVGRTSYDTLLYSILFPIIGAYEIKVSFLRTSFDGILPGAPFLGGNDT